MAEFRDAKIAEIRAQVGDGRVICGLSGGVDSAVAAVLIHEAIGDQLTCVFVDHGLMRSGEAEQVVSLFRNTTTSRSSTWTPEPTFLGGPRRRHRPRGQAQVHRQDLHRRVRGRGEEDRRRRLPRPGHALSRRDRERQLHRRALGDDQEPPQCRRPARADEHEAGRAAARIVQGRGARARPRARPARGVRRPASVPRARASPSASPARSRKERCDILRKADAIYLEEIRNAGLYDAIWQAFAVLLPVRTVGVMGDYRTYDNVCALRAVTSTRRHDRRRLSVRRRLPEPRRDPHRQRGRRASTAWSTTIRRSRRARSSGNKGALSSEIRHQRIGARSVGVSPRSEHFRSGHVRHCEPPDYLPSAMMMVVIMGRLGMASALRVRLPTMGMRRGRRLVR